MKKIAIIGAGISGLFIANLFKKNSNYQITIYEKNNSINLEEGYGIQLSVNSVKLLNQIEFSKFENDKKFNPKKVIFYSSKALDKICDLDIADFNSKECKYTTKKRSDLVNFLNKNVESLIKLNHSVSKIDQENNIIRLTFENRENCECDYLIISDGVFFFFFSLNSNNQNQVSFNKTLAIRGTLPNTEKIDCKSISLFFFFFFYKVIYRVNFSGVLIFLEFGIIPLIAKVLLYFG